jgi:hypothetical protein
MDIGMIRGLGTVVVMVAFIGLALWVFSPRRKRTSTRRPAALCGRPRSHHVEHASKLLGANNNDYLLESVRHRPESGHHLRLTWLLLSTRKGQREESTDETVGHAFDGIEEYDNPLPKWWFWLFVGTIVFALGYLVLYPGLGNWKGVLPGYNYLDNDKQTEFANGQPAGPACTSGKRKWPRPTPASGRSSPSSPPCRWKKWPRTRKH